MRWSLEVATALAAMLALPSMAANAEPRADLAGPFAGLQTEDIDFITFSRMRFSCPPVERQGDLVIVRSCGRATGVHETRCASFPPQETAALFTLLAGARPDDRALGAMALDATIQIRLRDGRTIEAIILTDTSGQRELGAYFSIGGRFYFLSAQQLRALDEIATVCPTN